MSDDPNGEVRDTLIVSLRHNGKVSIKRENRFCHRPDAPVVVKDPRGEGYAWFEMEQLPDGGQRNALALEGPNGNISLIDMKIIVFLVSGFLEQAQKEALMVKQGAGLMPQKGEPN